MSFCAQCGKKQDADERFCTACGAPLSPATASPGPAPDSAASGASPGFSAIPAGGSRSRARLIIPIVVAAGILVLAGAGFLTYWELRGGGGSSSPSMPISAGLYHTCALASGGTIECWGYNGEGQLGNGSKTNSSIPVRVSGIATATLVGAGGSTWENGLLSGSSSCALLAGGTVDCWGYNDDGELGNGTTTDSSTPVQASGIVNASSITAGGFHACAVLSAGTVKCWGDNEVGQLGNGTTTKGSTPTPVQVSGITNATHVSAGYAHTCALLAGGTVECWGLNDSGQLGNGTKTNSSTPIEVSGITNAKSISAGGSHACALLSDGTVECWGFNQDGQLGDATKTNSSIPVQVSGLTNAKSISAGFDHTCAVLSDGTVECWGDNEYGQFGNGTKTSSSSPVQVSGITNAKSVTAGYAHTCALLSGNTVKCWGLNDSGQLGNAAKIGNETPVTTPVSVIGFP